MIGLRQNKEWFVFATLCSHFTYNIPTYSMSNVNGCATAPKQRVAIAIRQLMRLLTGISIT